MSTQILLNKKNFFLFLRSIVFVLLFIFTSIAHAQAENISFPIPELGNCQNQDECKVYCDRPENIDACLLFGEENDLITEEEAARTRAFERAVSTSGGPGGCSDAFSCEAYCSELVNFEECIAFADQSNFGELDIEDAQKIVDHVKSGGQLPGGCTSEASCTAYCDNFANIKECTAFLHSIGMAEEQDETVEEAAALQSLWQAGKTPGGCDSWESCDQYCENEANREECFQFHVAAGFVDEEEMLIPLKEVLEGVPEEVVVCVEQGFGTDVVDPFILEEKLEPIINDCFIAFDGFGVGEYSEEESFHEIPAQGRDDKLAQGDEGFFEPFTLSVDDLTQGLPPEVTKCVERKLVGQKLEAVMDKIDSIFDACFQEFEKEQEKFWEQESGFFKELEALDDFNEFEKDFVEPFEEFFEDTKEFFEEKPKEEVYKEEEKLQGASILEAFLNLVW